MRYRTEKGTVSVRTIVGAGLAAAMLVGSLALGGCGASGGSSDGGSDEPAAEEREPSRTPEETAEAFVQALFDGDGETMWNLLAPEMREVSMEQEDMTEDEAIDELSSMAETNLAGMEDYIDDIVVTEAGSSDLDEDEIADIEDTYSSDYDMTLDIEEGKTVDLEVTIVLTDEMAEMVEGQLDEDDLTEEMSIDVLLIDGEWYVEPTGAGF